MSNKFRIVSKVASGKLSKLTEEEFFKEIENLHEKTSSENKTGEEDFSKIDDYVTAQIASSKESEFREPDFELFSTFLGGREI